MSLLEVKDLKVAVKGKLILHDVNLKVENGETHVLLGPNACGKTTLALAIIGYPAYKIVNGKILFEGRNLEGLSIDERARLGIGIAYQNSPSVRGVKMRDIIRLCGGLEPFNQSRESEGEFASRILGRVGLNPKEYLSRDVNLGFSGGERKRSELAQVFAMKPKLMILDEPDSGVDIDSLKLIGNEISRVVKEIDCSVLVITHHRHILNYLKPEKAHILYGGRIIGSGNPDEIIGVVEDIGYHAYAKKLGILEE